MSATGIGASVRRVEDVRFITGRGRYTDDMNQPGQVYAVFLRSPYARARIVERRRRRPRMEVEGVLAVLTGRDMAADGLGDLPCGWLVKSKDGTDMRQPPHPPLAVERCNYVGEPYGVVIATTLAAAREGADAVMTDFEELEAVVAAADATKSTQIYANVPANRSYQWELGDKAATDQAFARAAHVTKLDITNNRLIPNALEPRAAIGVYDAQQRIVHAVHHESEPAPRAPGAVGFREARAGTQAARRRARRRRRFRFEDLHLSGRNDGGVGVASHRPSGEVDGGTVRIVPGRCARPRSRDARGTGARRRRGTFSACA